MIVFRSTHRAIVAHLEEQVAFLKKLLEQERAEHGALQESLLRIERRRNGMTETPRPTKPRREQGALPPSLSKLIDGFESALVRADLRRRAQRMYMGGKEWDECEKVLRSELGI